jgi:hypothetical protein
VTTDGDPPASWLAAANDLDRWMADRDYAGHDPHDFLASPLVRAATLGSRWAAVAWTQLGRRLPVQIRPALRVPAARNPKGIGLVLAAQVRLAEAEAGGTRPGPTAARVERCRELVRWLDGAADRSRAGAGWGYPFPWANRDFMAPAGTPSSVATAFVGHALLDAADRLGLAEARALAEEAGPFLTTALQRIPGPDGTFCFSYTPLDRRPVHNASLLAASLLARLGGADTADTVRGAVEFTLRAQRDDGSWPYGVGRRNQWVDGFHTGYILLALDGIRAESPRLKAAGLEAAGLEAAGLEAAGLEAAGLEAAGLEAAIERGIAYWRASFFDGPAVGSHPGERYPVDAHAVAQAILTHLGLRHRIPDARAEARRLARWLVAEMRDPDGHYHYLRYARWRNRLPYMRWVQAWVLRALAELALAEAGMQAGNEATGSD